MKPRQLFDNSPPLGQDGEIIAAHAELRRQQTRYGFALTVVDVDTDPWLVAEHGEWVPVVAVNGRLRFRGRVNPVLLARLLRGESGRPPDRA